MQRKPMLAQTPPMGWNSWNTFGSNINETLIREVADQIVALGLRDAGYEYVALDDCWSEMERDPVTRRLLASKEKFPCGMKALGDYIHSKGLKFGIYSCAGVRTCAGYPGSFDHEFLDAETFAEWGVDLLKYDNCYRPETANMPLLYRRMGHALRNSGREILFSACNWGLDNVHSWARSAGAHIYRSTGDIEDNFTSFRNIALGQLGKLESSGPGCFNDFDMLTVGMFGKGNVGTTGCTATDYKTQFALWCFMGSPLMLGCDIRTIAPEIQELVKNRALIAINQDKEARPAFPVDRESYGSPDLLILVRFLEEGEVAVGFFNFSDKPFGGLTLLFESLGLPEAAGFNLRFTNVFDESDVIERREFFKPPSIASHDCAVYRAKLIKR